MSRKLSVLLGKPEHEIAAIIHRLEAAAGHPSEDIRFLSDHSQLTKAKLSQLNLDPEDTTPQELYHAIRAKFDTDAARLDQALGVAHDSPIESRIQTAADLVRHFCDHPEMWVLKRSSAKKMLKSLPPKKLPKQLHYRSIDSLLKRENVFTLYAALAYTESASWQKAFLKKMSSLSSADFEMREPMIVRLSAKYNLRADQPSMTAVSQLVGVIALDESKGLEKAPVLTLALQILEGLEELEAGRPEVSLHQAHPALHWWSDSRHLVTGEAEAVSMNLYDVALNHRDSMMGELMGRYAKHLPDFGVNLPGAADELTEKAGQLLRVPAKMKLAPEYSVAE
jgi:hypothetical protein